MNNKKMLLILLIMTLSPLYLQSKNLIEKKLAYIVSDIRIPFWDIMSRGIRAQAKSYGYDVHIYSAHNLKKKELQNTVAILKQDVDAIILSPINSSSATTVLKLAKNSHIPVVIADIGSDGGEYLSYISSDNYQGAYKIGKVLAKKMQTLGWDRDGSVGIIAIPQKRSNGKERTLGFMKAMEEADIKGAGLYQQVNFSYQETYNFARKLIEQNPQLKALWLQGSNRYEGALDAIRDSGNKGKILLVCFDAEPIFLELIPQGIVVGAAMQQPYLMGSKAVDMIHRHLDNQKVPKEIKLDILAISDENIEQMLPTIKRNVLGVENE